MYIKLPMYLFFHMELGHKNEGYKLITRAIGRGGVGRENLSFLGPTPSNGFAHHQKIITSRAI